MSARGLVRRCCGILLGGAPLWIAFASLLRSAVAPSAYHEGWWLLLPAIFFAGENVYTSWLRPWLYWRRHGSMEGYQHISGYPLIGNLFAVSALLVCFGNPWIAALGLATIAADTGGVPWFVLSTWRDRSLWDGGD